MGQSGEWSTGEGNGKPLQYSCLENSMNSVKGQKDRILKHELPRSVGTQYAAEGQWRMKRWSQTKNNTPFMDVIGDGSNIQCCKEQYCIGNRNVRSMNQGKLEVIKQEMATVNIDILGISELKWTGMAPIWNLIQMTNISTTVGKNPLEEME